MHALAVVCLEILSERDALKIEVSLILIADSVVRLHCSYMENASARKYYVFANAYSATLQNESFVYVFDTTASKVSAAAAITSLVSAHTACLLATLSAQPGRWCMIS